MEEVYMATLHEFTAGNAITVEVTDEAYEIKSKPVGGDEELTAKSPIKAIVKFNNIWTAHIGVFTWADGTHSVEISWSNNPVPPPFDDVVGRLRQTMKVSEGNWILAVRAGKKGAKDRPTLANVTWDELDALVGSDAKTFFSNFGEVQFGRYGDFVPNPGAMVNAIGARVSQDAPAVLVAIHIVTRALAVLRNLSK
jgi:hypothetical protein